MELVKTANISEYYKFVNLLEVAYDRTRVMTHLIDDKPVHISKNTYSIFVSMYLNNANSSSVKIVIPLDEQFHLFTELEDVPDYLMIEYLRQIESQFCRFFNIKFVNEIKFQIETRKEQHRCMRISWYYQGKPYLCQFKKASQFTEYLKNNKIFGSKIITNLHHTPLTGSPFIIHDLGMELVDKYLPLGCTDIDTDHLHQLKIFGYE